MTLLRSSTLRLELDLMKLQRHVRSFDKELLVTWQADTLTRLIEVIYERHRWKMPGGIAIGDYQAVSRDTLATLYSVAARKIKKETLKRRFGLGIHYYDALQKYDEVRAPDPTGMGCLLTGADCPISQHRPMPVGICVCAVARGREAETAGTLSILGEVVSIVLWSDGGGDCRDDVNTALIRISMAYWLNSWTIDLE